MRWSIFAPTAVALSLFGLATLATPLLAQTELNGAWTYVEVSGHDSEGDWQWKPVQPSLYIFLDGYYSIMYVRGSEARPLMAEEANRETITDEQMRSIFMPFVANSGTYEISGSTLTTRPMVALWPNFMEGGSLVFQYEIKEGMLMLRRQSLDEPGWWAAKLKRLR